MKDAYIKYKVILVIVSVLCCLSITVMIIAINKTVYDKWSFTPPAFDPNAITGVPEVPEELGYSSLEVEQGYAVYVCGKPVAKGRHADVYFTSPESNTVWLMLQIVGEDGRVLGETGIIRPGEYVKTVTLGTVPGRECKVKLKIIAYCPETYTSMGTIGLNTQLKKAAEF